ncbi:hypothetical protein BKA63DRAFT_583634 [Paraphoma chrysanthemicola]|nr:hypothetical protein BKA63DRAFT_583634 [Paraphoma chrysanthemicola]
MPCDAAQENCYLLDLPGEIRNRTYDYTYEEPIMYFPQRLRGHADAELRDYGVTRQKPLYWSLTQTCQQLRAEYLPVHAARATIHVCHVDLDEFMAAGLPLISRGDNNKMFGILRVDCRAADVEYPKLMSNGEDRSEEEGIDILPFLLLCATNPGLQVQTGLHGCECCSAHWPLRETLDQLLNIARWPNLLKWLKEAVCFVRLEFEDSLHFGMKDGYLSGWMSDFTNLHEFPENVLEYEDWKRATCVDLEGLQGKVMFEPAIKVQGGYSLM